MKYFILIILFSCSYIIPKQDRKWAHQVQKFNPQTQLCSTNSNSQFLASNSNTISTYKTLRDRISQYGISLSFIDEIILYSLIQIDARPDLTSPNSRFQFVIGDTRGKWIYRDYYGTSQTLMKGLEDILKTNKSNYQLKQLIQIYDQFSPHQLKIDVTLSNFLAKTASTYPSPEPTAFTQQYLRGDEVLHENETLPSTRLTSLLNNVKPPKININDEQSLIPYIDGPNLTVKCNYDMTLYDYSIFLISPQVITANTFGMSKGSRFFMAAASQTTSGTKLFDGTHIFEGASSDRAIPFCSINTNKSQYWIWSTNERDPVQHLHKIIKSGQSSFRNLETMGSLIHGSRHLFLTSPLRVAFEFQRSDASKIEEINKLEVPIYQADRLGMIHTFGEAQGKYSFILDDRFPEVLSCNP